MTLDNKFVSLKEYNEEVQLKDILIKLSEYKAYLLKKKFAILLVSSLCFILGILVAIMSDVLFYAELTFVVEAEQGGSSSLGAMSGIASQFGFDFGGSSSTTFTQERET